MFHAEIGRPRKRKKNCEQGEVFVKFFRVKKGCVGDGGERERALDDKFGQVVELTILPQLQVISQSDWLICRGK